MADPLFRNLESALLWAWYFARAEGGIVKGPSYAQFIKSDEQDRDETPRSISAIYTARRPTGLDGAAQAGMIKRFVMALPPVHQCHLMCAMLRADDRKSAQKQMALFLRVTLGEDAPDVALLDQLVRQHYGSKRQSMAYLAKRHGIDRRKVTGMRRVIDELLNDIAFCAERSAYERLQEMGVVA